MEIHRKPGYDPVELFLDPAITLPKLRIGATLLKRKSRSSNAPGCHSVGCVPGTWLAWPRHHRPAETPVLMTNRPMLLDRDSILATDVCGILLRICKAFCRELPPARRQSKNGQGTAVVASLWAPPEHPRRNRSWRTRWHPKSDATTNAPTQTPAPGHIQQVQRPSLHPGGSYTCSSRGSPMHHGVRIIPGSIMSADDTQNQCFRLPFVEEPRVLADATLRLKQAWLEMEARPLLTSPSSQSSG